MPARLTRQAPAFAALIVAVIAAFLLQHFAEDDSFIPFRYAEQWLKGNGPVWNPGERVEGYTSFLLLVLLRIAGGIGIDFFSAARGIEAVAWGTSLLLLYRAARQMVQQPAARDWLGVLAIILFAPSVTVMFWVMGGLEMVLFGALLLSAALILLDCIDGYGGEQQAVRGGLVLGFACLTRPEGIMLAGLWCAALLLKRGGRIGLAAIVPCAVLVGTHVMWRHSYYGEWLPNTFYAKLYGIPTPDHWLRGLLYAFECVANAPLLLGVALFVLNTPPARRAGSSLLVASLLAFLLYLIQAGGDWMPAQRLFVPMIPLVSLLALRGLASLAEEHASQPIAPVISWLLLVCCLLPAYHYYPQRHQPYLRHAALLGDYLQTHWPHGALVAINFAGITPMHAPDFRYLDMLGINDRHIAHRSVTMQSSFNVSGHSKGDGAYVVARQPDYLILGSFIIGGKVEESGFVTETELAENPAFAAHYRCRTIELQDPETQSFTFTYYERKKPR